VKYDTNEVSISEISRAIDRRRSAARGNPLTKTSLMIETELDLRYWLDESMPIPVRRPTRWCTEKPPCAIDPADPWACRHGKPLPDEQRRRWTTSANLGSRAGRFAAIERDTPAEFGGSDKL
jgi:hypothetical protein